MKPYTSALVTVCFALCTCSSAFALSVAEFHDWCSHSAGTACHDVPVVQAYVGGALDIVATAQDEDWLKRPAFCKKPQELFKVPAIIDYMQAHASKDDKRNAMYLVLQYLDENGGCVAKPKG